MSPRDEFEAASKRRRRGGLDAEARLALALDAGAIAGAWFWDVANDVFTADERFAATFGLDAAELGEGVPLGRVVQPIHPDDEPRVRILILEALGRGGPYSAEYRVARGNGWRWIEASGRVDLDGDGQPLRFPGVLVDIDRRKRAELRQAALLALGDSLRGLGSDGGISAATGEVAGRALGCFRAGLGLVDPIAGAVDILRDWRDGPEQTSIEGRHRFSDYGSFLSDLAAGRDVAIVDVRADPRTREAAGAFDALGIRAMANVPLMADGRAKALAFVHSAEPREWPPEELGFLRAVADRAWAALEASRASRMAGELSAGVDAEVSVRAADRDRIWRLSGDLMLVSELDGAIVAANPAWGATLGWEESDLAGCSLLDLAHPDDIAVARASAGAIRGGAQSMKFECRFRAKDGAYRRIEWTSGPGGGYIVSVGRDVTDDRARAAQLAAAEAQLRQSQKMEAVGQLTGGLAHDFNNMLSTINLSFELLRRRIGEADSEELLTHVGRGVKAVRSAAALIQRLLAFSRKQSLDYRAIDVDALVAGMAELLRRTLGERMSISTRAGAEGWLARADANQLEAALMNLAVNARDAMPEGGDLVVSCARLSLAEHDDPPEGAELGTGDYLAIAVSDTGTGMPPDVAARAFDPFFTTKGIGKGTGLGLSMIHGFAKQSGGDAAISTREGSGTTVTIFLPRAADPQELPARSHAPETPPMGRGQRILFVEDEPDVRAATAEALLRMGYSPRIARDAESALEILASQSEIDAMVSDVGLPGLDGRTLAARARELRPGLRVLFVTGYAASAQERNDFLAEGMDMLPKPFALDDLAWKLAKLIGPAR